MKPIIGITTECEHQPEDSRTRGSFKLNWNYAQAIADAGGVPLVIPPVADPKEVAQIIDGWLIPGGADIDAARFGEENHAKVELQDPARCEVEQELMCHISPDLPVLAEVPDAVDAAKCLALGAAAVSLATDDLAASYLIRRPDRIRPSAQVPV